MNTSWHWSPQGMFSWQENVKKKNKKDVFENKHQISQLQTEQTEPFMWRPFVAAAPRPSGPASAPPGCAAFLCSVKVCQGGQEAVARERTGCVGVG